VALQRGHTLDVRVARSTIQRALDRVALISAGTALGLMLHVYVFDIAVVEGDSMAPSLHEGDQIVIEKVTPRLGVLQRGEVIVLRRPESEELLVKRVIATGGDSVQARRGRVYVNGQPLDECAYAVMSAEYFFSAEDISSDEVFVLGDNRDNSEDSATWGPVPAAQVLGRRVAGPLPFQRDDRGNGARHARRHRAREAPVRWPLRSADTRTAPIPRH